MTTGAVCLSGTTELDHTVGHLVDVAKTMPPLRGNTTHFASCIGYTSRVVGADHNDDDEIYAR